MNNYESKLVDWKCEKCNKIFQSTKAKVAHRKRRNIPNLCPECMKAYVHETKINQFNNMNPEKRAAYVAKQKSIYANKSDEEKQLHSKRTKDQLAKRTPEEWAIINKKNSEGLKRHWKNQSKEYRVKRTANMQLAWKKKIQSMTPEERSEHIRKRFDFMTAEEKEAYLDIYRQEMFVYNASLAQEEKIRRANIMNEKNKLKSPEEKKDIYTRAHQWYYNLPKEEKEAWALSKQAWYDSLTPEKKIEFSKKISDAYQNLSDEEKSKRAKRAREWYASLSDEEKALLVHKILSHPDSGNSLTTRFVSKFYNTKILVDSFYFIPEYITTGETIHSWDFGIFDENGDLQMVVDLDGAYFHADNCDYDGLHSKEEYDEKRSLSLSELSNVKMCIINELGFDKSFNRMIQLLGINMNEYIENMFTELRSISFPYPHYTDAELISSFNKLKRMLCDDKYHIDISLNTRVGDRLIQHFHKSIYHAHNKGCISPYEAWYNDDLLKKCIKNRTIYQTRLNPNKILQGFNVSKIAPKVSVFSAGRAKLIISKYLSEFDTIFDPFSGFSGRMLGTISLGKRYIGQDISLIHVNESNQIKIFLLGHDFDINVQVIQQNILESSGEYPCLFTCPPYADKEQWEGTPVDRRTCDDWITECLNRFKCKRYVFVVDDTTKYAQHVVEEIQNKSHFGVNNEKIIVIDKE